MQFQTCSILFFVLMSCVKSDFFEAEMTEGRQILGFLKIEMKIKKFNKTAHVINGFFRVEFPLDDSYQLRLLLFKKQGNEYRLTPFHIGPYNFCDYIQNKALTYDELLGCSDLPARNVCPWPIKDYQLINCLSFLDKVPKFLSGDYRADIEILKNDETIGGYQMFFYVINMINSHAEKFIR